MAVPKTSLIQPGQLLGNIGDRVLHISIDVLLVNQVPDCKHRRDNDPEELKRESDDLKGQGGAGMRNLLCFKALEIKGCQVLVSFE